MTFRRALSHTTLCLFSALLAVLLLACSSEPPPVSPVPRNALEASAMWSGSRVVFMNQEGEPVLKIRHRSSSIKLFDHDLTPLAYARRNGESIAITPRIHTEDTQEPSHGLSLTQDTTPPKGVVARFTLYTQGDKITHRFDRLAPREDGQCHSWHISTTQGKPVATLTPKRDQTQTCDDPDLSWTLKTPDLSSFTSAALTDDTPRTIVLLKNTPTAQDSPTDTDRNITLRATSRSLPTISAAALHIPDLQPIERLAFLTLVLTESAENKGS